MLCSPSQGMKWRPGDPQRQVGALGDDPHLLAALGSTRRAGGTPPRRASRRRAGRGRRRGRRGSRSPRSRPGSSRRRPRGRWSGTSSRPSGARPPRRASSSSASARGSPRGGGSGARGRRWRARGCWCRPRSRSGSRPPRPPSSRRGEIHSSWASEACLKYAACWPSKLSRDDRLAAGVEDLLVDRGDQRLGRRRALDQAGVALLDVGRVADQDPRQVLDPRVPHPFAPLLPVLVSTLSSRRRRAAVAIAISSACTRESSVSSG